MLKEKLHCDGLTFVQNNGFGQEIKHYHLHATPRYKNDELLSGSINMGEVIEMKATKIYNDSTVAKILDLLESATDKKTKTETMISKISKIYKLKLSSSIFPVSFS